MQVETLKKENILEECPNICNAGKFDLVKFTSSSVESSASPCDYFLHRRVRGSALVELVGMRLARSKRGRSSRSSRFEGCVCSLSMSGNRDGIFVSVRFPGIVPRSPCHRSYIHSHSVCGSGVRSMAHR
jgi:hypothetical protein